MLACSETRRTIDSARLLDIIDDSSGVVDISPPLALKSCCFIGGNAMKISTIVIALVLPLSRLGATGAQAQCPTPRPAPTGPALWIPDQVVSPGSTTATITVGLVTAGAQIAGTQSDITFPAEGAIARRADGKADCTVNPAINKDATGFVLFPYSGCTGSQCLRVLVIASDNTDQIPDGSVLFTCNIDIAPGFLGTLTIRWAALS